MPNRTRTVLTPEAQSGLFSYISGGQAQTVNLFQLAAANNQLATPDPMVTDLLGRIRSAVNDTGTLTLTYFNARKDYLEKLLPVGRVGRHRADLSAMTGRVTRSGA